MTDPVTPTKDPVDPRAVVGGAVALVALICSTILALEHADATMTAGTLALATTALGYVFGLYSEPHS